jgi:carboxyl-terminal processing protease
MKHLILDLRNNGGGVLTSATDIADEFLKNNVPMLITKGKKDGKKTYRATSGGILENTGVTILINANSASASEILAGAIQDNDRGTIVGRRSFGKGLVQEDIKLRDGSDLRLTIARYYTPTGRCIQRPYDEGYDKYIEAQVERYDNGELYAPDSSLFVDSLKYRTPKGKIVYGGGGIMPDVFIPFDSTGLNWYFTELRFSQAFTAFTFDYVQDKRSKWSSVEDFARSFRVSDELIKSFVRFAEKEMKIKQNEQGLLGCKSLVAETLKAEIARQLWTEHGYYQIVNTYDNEVQKALKVSR